MVWPINNNMPIYKHKSIHVRTIPLPHDKHTIKNTYCIIPKKMSSDELVFFSKQGQLHFLVLTGHRIMNNWKHTRNVINVYQQFVRSYGHHDKCWCGICTYYCTAKMILSQLNCCLSDSTESTQQQVIFQH